MDVYNNRVVQNTYLRYGELVKLKLPYKVRGNDWIISRVDSVFESSQVFVHIDVKRDEANGITGKMANRVTKTVASNEQIKIDSKGKDISVMKYSLLSSAFKKKVYHFATDVEVLLRRRFVTVLKIEENNITEVPVRKETVSSFYNNIILAKGDRGLEFYIFGNAVASIKHIKAIDDINIMKLHINL